MSLDVALRAATVEDAPSVAEVIRSSRKAFVPYAPLEHTDAEVDQWVLETLIPSGGVAVACVGVEIVGVLAMSRESNVGWIDQLYIAPRYVGQGMGSRLLDHAVATLGLPVRLHTFQANTRSRLFYERYGFKAVSLGDGSTNEEGCPDVLYELTVLPKPGA
jgi:GNAT superfamily N-acetyltransferase